MFVDELPDARPDLIQPEVHSAFEVQHDGFAVQLAKHDVIGNAYRRVERQHHRCLLASGSGS